MKQPERGGVREFSEAEEASFARCMAELDRRAAEGPRKRPHPPQQLLPLRQRRPRPRKRPQEASGLPPSVEVWFDGATEPVNPGGHMGYGAAIYRRGVLLHEISAYVPASPETSNNVAEYLALTAALEWLLENGLATEPILVRGDSRLVINQVFGYRGRKWRIKAGLYVPYALRVVETVKRFRAIFGCWIPREENAPADHLSKRELLARGVRFRIQPGR